MIERLRLKNFRRFKDETFDFINGMNFIKGINNAGKTSLFYAIEYVLFGRVGSFKSQIALMHPGEDTLGVEIIFKARDGERYRLQRIHTILPKSRTKIVGHYTLKKLVENGEVYVLSSDFQDREEAVALKLFELLGITRKLFDVSINLKQGEIISILDGMPQLDIVLGITSVVHAANEMNSMALEREKETANLPVFQQTEKHFENDSIEQKNRLKTLEQDIESSEKKMKELEGIDDIHAETKRIRMPLTKVCSKLTSDLKSLEKNNNDLNFTSNQLNELINESGEPEKIEKQISDYNDQENDLQQKKSKLNADLNQFRSKQTKLDLEKGDIKGRIKRRKALPGDEQARCETCGQIIDQKLNETEITKWSSELDIIEKEYKINAESIQKNRLEINQIEEQLKVISSKKAEFENIRRNFTKFSDNKKSIQDSLLKAMINIEKSIHNILDETSGCITEFENFSKKNQDKIKLIFDIAKYKSEFGKIITEQEKIVFCNEFIEKLNNALSLLDDKIKETVVRAQTEASGLRSNIARFKSDLNMVVSRINNIEKELAATKAKVEELKLKELTAVKLRKLADGFKDVQIKLRDQASKTLSNDTYELHKKLSAPDNEFNKLNIDSKDYIVYVTPYDLNKEVPANLYQGGGHKLLIGLAFKLAIARLISKCPFILLDEPTYGLDSSHFDSLLNRLEELRVCNQLLLITHHDIKELAGNHIRIVRDKKISKKEIINE